MAVKEKIGIVVNDKMDKTKIVAVNDRVTHRRYGKVITKTKRYAVHDSKLNMMEIKSKFAKLLH